MENNLSATNKSWLHITDDAHFIEKLDDITCPKTDLNPLAIVNLAELLNLNSYYLTEFSNASYESQAPKENKKEIFEGIKKMSKSYLKMRSAKHLIHCTKKKAGSNCHKPKMS